MKKILIIDNSQLIINVLQDLFSKNNVFKVHVAKSLSEVENKLKSNEYFLSISNMVLPDALNGELLYTLKSANIPVIILSSKIDEKTIEEVNKFEVLDYILKDSNGFHTVVNLSELFFFIKGKKVLIVEDSTSFAEKLNSFLKKMFLKVIVVKDGKQALDYIYTHEDVSLVLTDYNMPNFNGLELIHEVRKVKSQTELPMVLLSTQYDDTLKTKAYKFGVNDFLSKPILLEELKSKILNIYSQSKKINQIEEYNKMFDDQVIASVTNDSGVITWVSNAFCHISGYSKAELIGNNHNIVRHPDMPSNIYTEMWSTIKSGKVWKGEIKNLRKDGTYYWVASTISPEFDYDGDIIGFHSVRQDITDKKRIYELSITDGLTNLYNRRFFNDVAKEQLHHSSRSDSIFSFVILDVDNFKKYNDNYGHQKGDEVLKSISKVLKDIFKRNDDFIFRLGGEEFGVILHSKTLTDIKVLVEKARIHIELLNIEHKENFPLQKVTASFGFVSITSKKDLEFNIDRLYKLADDKLYEAKESGRNKVEFLQV